MPFRSAFRGAALAVGALLVAATSASAQYTYTVTLPAPGSNVPIFRSGSTPSTNLVSTSSTTDAPLIQGSGILTPFFNYNQTAPGEDTNFINATQGLTVTASKNGVPSPTGPLSLTITVSGVTTSSGNGAVSLTPGTVDFSTNEFVFHFLDGSTLTLGGFQASNATGTAGNTNGSDGLFGFSTISVTGEPLAPEPSSLPLAATGLCALIGTIAVRRRWAA